MSELKLRIVVAADMEGKGYTHHLSSFGKPYKVGDVFKIAGEHYLVEPATRPAPERHNELRDALEGIAPYLDDLVDYGSTAAESARNAAVLKVRNALAEQAAPVKEGLTD